MAGVTRQYLSYVDQIRSRNLELAAEYLLMAAMLIEIKSRMLLPPKKPEGAEPEDPRAELVRRLLEYEQMKLAAAARRNCRRPGATSCAPRCTSSSPAAALSRRAVVDLQEAWRDILQARQAGAAPQDQPRAAVACAST
jgi:segregation and condensation protein A